MPTPSAIVRMPFPLRGISIGDAYSAQAPQTAPIGVNVQAFETLDSRGRGGSRPGLLKLVDDFVPVGALAGALIQDLNTVITTDAENVPLGIDYPDGPVIANPSSPGPPSSWGFTPAGDPRSTRSPQDNFPVGGTGRTPNKNQRVRHHLTIYGANGVKTFGDTQTWSPGAPPFYTGFLFPGDVLTCTYSSPGDGPAAPVGSYPVNVGNVSITANSGDTYTVDAIVPGTLLVNPVPPPVPKHCFQGNITIVITRPPPDPFHWNGLTTVFNGVLCAPYDGITAFGPDTALVTKTITTNAVAPAGTLLRDYIAKWLTANPGAGSFGTVITDLYGLPSAGTCSGDPCSGAPIPSISGTGVGVIIGAG